MGRRRHVAVAVGALIALALAGGASGETIVGYTATGTPGFTKPSTQAAYTVTFTNTSAEKSADRATIAVPTGFSVVSGTVHATATCGASTWTVESIADGKVVVRRSGGSQNNLCPGGTLTVAFSATSSAVEGTYEWTTELFRDTDTFVLAGAQPSVTVDGTAPVVVLTSKPPNPSNLASASFAFTADEAETFACKLDGGAFSACTSPKNYSGLPDGFHTFLVRATDRAGNTGQADYTWQVETTLPIVLLDQTPANPSSSKSATFAFHASKLPATLQCSLDNSDFANCSSPKAFSDLPDGLHTFAVRATNAVANTGADTVFMWVIDTVGPPTAITAGPADPTNSRSAAFAFVSEPGVTLRCKLDDAAFTACASPQTYGGLGDGRHTFAVTATDGVGNVGPEAARSWTIETRPPIVTVTSGPPSLGNATSATFAFAADEPATYECDIDERGFQPCSSPASFGGLREGGHAFVVRGRDAAGNLGAASRSWAIDVTAPRTTIESGPRARTTAATATFRFSASEPATFECRLDARAFVSCTSPKTYRAISSGRHSFTVRAADRAGNVEPVPPITRGTVTPVIRNVAAPALSAPGGGPRVTSPPLLRWRPVRRATYYNVQLYRAGRKLLTAWPRRTSLQLRSSWRFAGREQRLTPGTYRWYVWPGYGPTSARKYGRMLGTSTFVVTGRRSR